MIETAAIAELLAYVDEIVPRQGCESVWLTGSRARGTAKPDSDWDVVAVHCDAPSIKDTGPIIKGVGWIRGSEKVELVIIAPTDWNDPRRYMTDCRRFGVRIR